MSLIVFKCYSEGDRVVAQAIQFFAAGFETTSATISFALYELALHPEMQDEARQCVQDLVNKGEKLNYDTMLQLTYLDRIVLGKYLTNYRLSMISTNISLYNCRNIEKISIFTVLRPSV